MNIVVPIKQIPDLQQIRIRDNKPLLDGVPKTLSAIDKNAIEAAVQLKEARGSDDEVVIVMFGDDDIEDTVKEAVAAGADRSVLITDDDAYGVDGSDVARVLAKAIGDIVDAQVIIFGEGSGDNYSGQVGSRVAQILGYPQVGFATEIAVEGDKATITRTLEDVQEVVEAPLPVIVNVAADLNEPRIPSVMQVLKAGKKPKEFLELDDLDVEIEGGVIETVKNEAPVLNRKQQKVKDVAELIEALKADNIIGR